MKPANTHIFTINGGSSSFKFALYKKGKPLKRGLHGKIDRSIRRNTSFGWIRFQRAPFPIIHSRVLPHSEAAPASGNSRVGTRADRGASDFSSVVLAGRQQQAEKAKRKERKIYSC
jgi:acetate kinase